MRSGPIAATAALLSLALILSGCGGGEGTAAGGGETTRAAKTKPSAPTLAKRCGGALGDFLDSIESLGNALAVGLDYEQYLSSVNRVRASYAGVDAERLGVDCLSQVASPAERALNVYIDAANAWGDCLATASCDPESIESRLQREWEEASGFLAEARRALRG